MTGAIPRTAKKAMRRRSVIKGAAAIAALPLFSPLAAGAEQRPLRLKRGINVWPWFSLTMEYPAPRTDYAWPPFQPGRPVPRRQDLDRLAAQGFDFIRLPVDPGPFLAFEGQRRTDLLATLDEAVTLALRSGLSVVLNVQANAATHYWEPRRMLASTSAPEFPAYADLVGEVASRLAHTDLAHVAIEPVNEPPQACASADWTGVQAALLATVRAAAPGLTYVASGGCGSMIAGLTELPAARLRDGGPTLFTFHFYEPYLFTHQGAPWMTEPVYRSLNDVPWPGSAGTLDKTLNAVRRRMAADHETTAEAKASAYALTQKVLKQYFDAQPAAWFIKSYFDKVEAWRVANAVEAGDILLGEFGALRSDDRYVAAPAPDRARYIADVREIAESFGYPWAYWNLFDGFGLFEDDTARAFDPPILAALGLAAT